MRENCTSGSVRGVPGNRHSYREIRVNSDMGEFQYYLLPIMLVGFFGAFIIQFRLHKYVSREKVMATKDVTQLWKNSVPPKTVLNDEGLRLHKYFILGISIFIGSCFLMVFGGFVTEFLNVFTN